jgi:phenylalanine ammonia-lyase
MKGSNTAHATQTFGIWNRLQDLKSGSSKIVLDGNNLDIATIVAVARHAVEANISEDKDLLKRLDQSIEALGKYLVNGENVVYGVNTGFGGSADVRTAMGDEEEVRRKELLDLQIGLLQHTQSAIISDADKDPQGNSEREPGHVMPPEWVRGAMIARANQNLRGHSAIRVEVLKMLVNMVKNNIVPMVPLRGTISASGDLMPMSYIAGAVIGNPDVWVQIGRGKEATVLPANEALKACGLHLEALQPKEGLALINGTAPSVAVASLVLYDAHQLVYLSQRLTAYASEALGGNVEWAQPFPHKIRPHPGQIEAAANIKSALEGSKFVVGLDSRRRTGDGLWQDRYSTRTAPQWIGPYLEDLLLAQSQLEIELNSTSDNPLVDVSEGPNGEVVGDVYSAGNFQAVTVTSAMDKARNAVQMIGRMIFSQVSEMINPATNNGLEANLNASNRENFTMKGIDTNMSAYMSELAALAHPVSSHVMSAEMHNQGINSLALVSARKTIESVDILRHMMACHLFVTTQGVELRASHRLFQKTLAEKVLVDVEAGAFSTLSLSSEVTAKVAEATAPVINDTWMHWNAGNWTDRVKPTVEAVLPVVTGVLTAEGVDITISQLQSFRNAFEKVIVDTANTIFYPNVAITPVDIATELGEGTAPIYTFIRSGLSVPPNYGLEDDPLFNHKRGRDTTNKKTIGSWVTKIYESLNKATLLDAVFDPKSVAPRSEQEFVALGEFLKTKAAQKPAYAN